MKISGIEKPCTERPSDWREARRLRALALSQKGWQQNRIAEALGVTKGAVSQWLKKTRNLPHEQHEQALKTRKSTGRKPALTAENRSQLLALVERGATTFGFIGDVWTANRVRTVSTAGVRPSGRADDNQEVLASGRVFRPKARSDCDAEERESGVWVSWRLGEP